VGGIEAAAGPKGLPEVLSDARQAAHGASSYGERDEASEGVGRQQANVLNTYVTPEGQLTERGNGLLAAH
jgi:hypothetical protein